MAVTGKTTFILFCEGKPDSVFFNRIMRESGISSLKVQSTSGKFAMNSFIDGYTALSDSGYIAVRDRDFDQQPPDLPQLIETAGQKPIFLLFRTCIENYFIEPEFLNNFWIERQNAPALSNKPAPGPAQIKLWTKSAAEEIKDYQAVRWALASLKPGRRWPEIDSRWTEKSGLLPQLLDFDSCLGEAKTLVNNYSSQTSRVEESALEATANEFREKFNEPSFLEDEKFMVWFHGKDLLAALRKHLPNGFPKAETFIEWCADNADIDLIRFPDLKVLVEKTKSQANEKSA